MKEFIGHIHFVSGTDDAEIVTDQVACLEDQLELVSGLGKKKCVTSSQTATTKNENR